MMWILWPFSKTVRRCATVQRLLKRTNGDYGQFLSEVGHYAVSHNDPEFVTWVKTNMITE